MSNEEFKDFDENNDLSPDELIQRIQKMAQEPTEEEKPKEFPSAKEEVVEKLSSWEELDNENCVVKKYIFYISKDFIPLMDSLDADKRSAYVNDAIQRKIDSNNIKKLRNKKIRLFFHFAISIIIILALTPFALLAANKAIMATFDSYKYSQDNFEKLYKNHFEKNKIYSNTLHYNKSN